MRCHPTWRDIVPHVLSCWCDTFHAIWWLCLWASEYAFWCPYHQYLIGNLNYLASKMKSEFSVHFDINWKLMFKLKYRQSSIPTQKIYPMYALTKMDKRTSLGENNNHSIMHFTVIIYRLHNLGGYIPTINFYFEHQISICIHFDIWL